MNIYIYSILTLLFTAISSCTNMHSGQVLKSFENIYADSVMLNSKTEMITQGLNIVINHHNIDKKSYLFMSDLVDTIYGIKLETNEESLIGTIDKIKIKNNKIYVLDRYKTHSMKCFDLSGKFLFTIGCNGNGPGEYIEPTDFYIGQNEITIYDQFQTKFLYYNSKGVFLHEKRLPFTFLQFYQYSSNNYIMRGLDAENYHLKDLLDYSIWKCDSTFHIKQYGLHRKKNKYIIFFSNSDLNDFSNKLYFHEFRKDTIYSIDSTGAIKYDYIINFGKKTPPQSLFLLENEKEFDQNRNIDENYAFGNNFAITPNYFYYSFSVGGLLYHLIHSKKDNKTFSAPRMINDFNFLYPFTNIRTAQGDTLIGYADAMQIYDIYNRIPEEKWAQIKNHNGVSLAKEGIAAKKFGESLKADDNPIIINYVLKKHYLINTHDK